MTTADKRPVPPITSDAVRLNPHAELVCPRCDGANLHHGTVRMWERGEDVAQVTLYTIDAPDFSARVAPNAGNPSLRRHGMAIQFSCELCGGTSELTVAQHKGCTLMAWREPAA